MIRANDPPSPAYRAGPRNGLPGRAIDAQLGARLDAVQPQLARQSEKLRLTQTPPEEKRDGARGGPGRLTDEILEHFAMELGLQTGLLVRYIKMSPSLDIRQLHSLLQAVLRRNPGLAPLVSQADQSLGGAIEEGRAAFLASRDLNRTEAADLDEIAAALDELRTMLILGKGGAYQNVLARVESELRADEAAGRILPGDESLLRAVESHRADIADANLETLDGWLKIMAALESFSRPVASNAGHQPPPANPA